MKPFAAWGVVLALGLIPAAALAQDDAQDSQTATAPDPAACEVRDVNGMITVVVCPPGLNAVGWQAAGRIACADRQPCLAWIWDDADLAPETAPETSEGLGGAAIVSAVGVWVNDDRQFIPMEQPYVGVGADETLGADPLDPLGLGGGAGNTLIPGSDLDFPDSDLDSMD